ncbi:16S rRNA methyltransferase [Endozoicomonas montiporae]|uniref:Ribosomal RNA small subunit methyltransferase E n=2 Tax=Endozoicomonas montiporae TaxID=1027273 RepID=A0A081MZQ0_9GAMM|nr:16S rRNA (uracil(1498)-N(3))-methyltransferase [Endozoicomonas montiporae]AMO54637.1 ribosomal RNA small subunit methyltransferase E [Endozoicomonas montiporae CL-33]KEQ11673.1 16S rRNA methyltransferase [Endozoicomonas montiporae]
MRNPRIYFPQPMNAGSAVELTDSAANHVGKVLRMKPQEPLILFDGEGSAYRGKIESISKKSVVVQLEHLIEGSAESPLSVHLGQSLSRGERMDYAIQKATEVGVTDITPLFSERCEVKLNKERQDKRLRHWQQVAISACEQCVRNRVPVIHPAMSVEDWMAQQTSELKFVLHHRTERRLDGYEQPASVSLLIGPEGGLTADEIQRAEQSGFNALALGPRVLRTETAPVSAITLMQYLWGDLR